MEHFFAHIQVDTYAQMHTRVKLLGGSSQIIGGDIRSPPRVSAPLILWQLHFV